MRPSIIEMADIPLDVALLKLVELHFYLFFIFIASNKSVQVKQKFSHQGLKESPDEFFV